MGTVVCLALIGFTDKVLYIDQGQFVLYLTPTGFV